MSFFDDALWMIHVVLSAALLVFVGLRIAKEDFPVNVRSAHIWFFLCLAYIYLFEYSFNGVGALYTGWFDMRYDDYRTYHFLLFSTLIFSAAVIAVERRLIRASFEVNSERTDQFWIEFVAASIILLYVAVLLVNYSFSVQRILVEAIASRGERFQEIRYITDAEQNPLFALLGIMQPAAVAIIGERFAGAPKISFKRGILLVVGLFLLFSQGSRTAFSIALLPGIVVFAKRYSPARRLTFFSAIVCALVVINGVIYQFRSVGLGQSALSDFEFRYHQDNNFALTLHALSHADHSTDRGSLEALLRISLLNWIPRTLWPSKPSPVDLNLDSYRESWWTQGYVGELVATAGVPGGLFLSILFVSLLFLVFVKLLSVKRLQNSISWGFIATLYVYMCMRSLINITAYMYVLFPFVLGLLCSRVRVSRRWSTK